MTNEELAVCIRDGDESKQIVLWEQIKKFVYKMANAKMDSIPGNRGVSAEDLVQSGYIAMVEATRRFDETKQYAFLTLFGYYLKKEFNRTLLTRTKRERMDPLNFCDSFASQPYADADFVLEDTIVDPNGEKAFRSLENADFRRAVKAELRQILMGLSDVQREVLHRRYYCGESYEDIGKAMGLRMENVRQIESKALREMRHPKNNRDLCLVLAHRK